MSDMRRYVPVLVAGAALIAAACRDSVAPTSSAPVTTFQLSSDQSFASNVSSTEGANGQSLSFTFTRSAGAAQLGEFLLTWEANSVCDPATSGYGFGVWDTACAPAAADIPMTVKLWEDNGRIYADFFPDIRFSPDRNVTLTVNRPEIIGRKLTKRLVAEYSIYYTYRVGDTRLFIDEAWFDPTQRSHLDTTTGDVWRRIKHFSGFVIRTGVDEGSTPIADGAVPVEP